MVAEDGAGRHCLDERGLLSPVPVDPDTGYRSYDLGQTRVAGLLHLGRQMGLVMGARGGAPRRR